MKDHFFLKDAQSKLEQLGEVLFLELSISLEKRFEVRDQEVQDLRRRIDRLEDEHSTELESTQKELYKSKDELGGYFELRPVDRDRIRELILEVDSNRFANRPTPEDWARANRVDGPRTEETDQ